MENQKEKRIGVMDSGLGGLTVVRELVQLLPMENIVFFGDNTNCPYGNRPREEILNLSLAMLDFMQSQNVKIAAIACNTISTMVDELRRRYEFPIVSIIEEACKYAAARNLKQLGVFATGFTIKADLYTTLIQRLSPETEVYGVSSRTLAALVDEGRFDDPATGAEVRSMLELLLKAHPEVSHIVLGCTHYPLVQDLFEKAAPGVTFINPAALQAAAVKALLSEQDLLRETRQPRLEIFTSGETSQYEAALKKLNIKRPFTVTTIKQKDKL